MAETKHAIERPISPHLGIYRMTITMLMSIMHRITGVGNYIGTLLVAAWLVSIAIGPDAYAAVNAIFGHPLGKLVLFGYTWNVFHHMLGGIRHLIWDTGHAMQPPAADTLAWFTIIGSLTLTVLLWGLGLWLRGGF